MEVKALFNEQSITLIEAGMPAEIRVDALPGVIMKGIVSHVSQYAEQSGFFSSNVRKYAVLVRILTPPKTLKPGMNASVTVQVRYEKDVLTAPIQTVYGVQDRHFCLVKTDAGLPETREVQVDGNNSERVIFKSGVSEGDRLVMNPGAYKEIMDLPEFKLDTRIELNETELQEAEKTRKKSDAKKAEPSPTDGTSGATSTRGGNRPADRNRESPSADVKPAGRPGQNDQPARRPGAGSGAGGNVSAMLDRMMNRYDTNSDGQIDADELQSLDERARNRIQQADSNGDGKVSREELEKGVRAMMRRFQQSGGGSPGGRP